MVVSGLVNHVSGRHLFITGDLPAVIHPQVNRLPTE